jgi:hypothetical protein
MESKHRLIAECRKCIAKSEDIVRGAEKVKVRLHSVPRFFDKGGTLRKTFENQVIKRHIAQALSDFDVHELNALEPLSIVYEVLR